MAIDDKNKPTDFKDYLIVSSIVFLVSSDWFDNWVRNMFPQLTNTNPFMFALIKTLSFAGLYWLYQYFMKNSNTIGVSSGDKKVTVNT